jgi:uncharacterized protein with ParB-like and HNH nuclease domain
MATAALINTSKFLEPTSLTLDDFLTENFYLIPDYQRDYSWGEEEVKQLWEDFFETSRRCFTADGHPIPNPVPHFIGAVVLQVFPPQEHRNPEVIDGQQRLVTITTLISVLLEFASEIMDEEDRENWKESLKGLLFIRKSGQKIPRLTLARDDQHYQALICNRKTQSDRETYFSTLSDKENSVALRVINGTRIFHKCVSDYVGALGANARDKRIIQLMRSVLQLTVVLEMKVYEQGVAYEVFENLNSRGLELQQADLLKNKLYALAQQQGTKPAVIAAWERTVKAIEQQSMLTLTEFFYFHLIAKHRDFRLSDLYKQVLDHLKKPGNNAKDYLEDVAKSAEHVQQMLEAGTSFSTEFARDITSIKDLIPNKYSLTLLISGAARFIPTSIEMAKVVKLTHHYVFRRFIVDGLSLAKYATEISKFARGFATGEIADLATLSQTLSAVSPKQSFEAKLNFFNADTNKLGFYIIEMIENHINKNAGTLVQRQNIMQHLEHIMPKRPTDTDWPQAFNNPNHPIYVNRIGNLLVLEADKNQYIRNKSFAIKNSNLVKKDYQNSKLTLPSILVKYLKGGEWNFESIEERQREMVEKYANDVWSLEA